MRARLRGQPAWPALAVVCAAAATTVVVLGVRLTFFNDDWYFLLQRPGLTADSLFAPHNGHLAALAVLAYKGLVAAFGLHAQLPFRLLLGAAIAALGVVVYLLVAERAGAVLGLMAATIVVFLGPAWEDLLWSFQIGLIGSLASGLGALRALERDDPRRNAVACGLLVISISLSDVGLPFVVGAAIAVALRRRPAQLWIPGLSAALFGIWYAAYGADAPSSVSGSNLEHLPRYLFDSVSVGLASLTGLNHGAFGGPYWPGRALLIVAALGLVLWLVRGRRPAPWIAVFAGSALTFWGLAGANFIVGREPFASRYQLIDVTFLILIATELLRPVRLGPRATAVAGVLALAVLVSNLDLLGYGYRFMRDHGAYAKVDLGALTIAHRAAPPRFQLFEPVARDPYLSGVTAARYFDATAAHGAPALSSPRDITRAPAGRRQAADTVLAGAYGMRLVPTPLPRPQRGCVHVGTAPREAPLPPGRTLIVNRSRSPALIGVRRFAPANRPVGLGGLRAGAAARISVPHDAVARAWQLVTGGPASVELCPLASG